MPRSKTQPAADKAPSTRSMVAFPCSRDEKDELDATARRYSMTLKDYLMGLHAKQLRTLRSKSEEVA